MEEKVYLLPFDKKMCLASCTLYLLVWLEKNYPRRYNQKDLLIRIIASPAEITLLGRGKKFKLYRHEGKLLWEKVTAQSRKGYMAISKQSEAHYSTDRKVIQTWKKNVVFNFLRREHPDAFTLRWDGALLSPHTHQLSLKSWILTAQLHYSTRSASMADESSSMSKNL